MVLIHTASRDRRNSLDLLYDDENGNQRRLKESGGETMELRARSRDDDTSLVYPLDLLKIFDIDVAFSFIIAEIRNGKR